MKTRITGCTAALAAFSAAFRVHADISFQIPPERYEIVEPTETFGPLIGGLCLSAAVITATFVLLRRWRRQ
jgi:hypothetical protein